MSETDAVQPTPGEKIAEAEARAAEHRSSEVDPVPSQGMPMDVDPLLTPDPTDPALNPYPAGHPNMPAPEGSAPGAQDSKTPHVEASATTGPTKAINPVMGLYDPVTSPLFGGATEDPGAVTGATPASAAKMSADYERVRIAAHEFANAIRGFGHDPDPETEVGKVVNFFRDQFGIKRA